MKYLCTFLLCCCLGACCNEKPLMAPYLYHVAETPWNEALGNHRAVLDVPVPGNAVYMSFDWRRPDKDVDARRLLVVNASTGDTIRNIKRLQVNNERCELMFGPVKEKGTYYFYYLPYEVQPGHGFYYKGYYPKEEASDKEWLAAVDTLCTTPAAIITKVESRFEFDSFYPMEIIASKEETDKYRKANPASFHVFPEDRAFPIRMKNNVPYKWLAAEKENSFKGKALPNEYYALQIGVWASGKEVKNLQYKTNGLASSKKTIPSEAITCFNINGINPAGQPFTKIVNVMPGAVQPLWFGVDIAADQPAGTYKGTIEISDSTGVTASVPVELIVSGKPIADRGDSEPWRHSRLRWLNSTLGISDKPTTGYENMQVDENRISCFGRTVSVSPQSGLPSSIDSWGHELLASPMRFVIQTSSGEKNLDGNAEITGQNEGKITGRWVGEDNDLSLTCNATMEFDGWINYVYTVTPKRDIEIKDIRLEIPMKKEAVPYFMGMGLPGQDMPRSYTGKWNTPETTVNNYGVSIPVSKQMQWLWPFDSFWCGSDKAGIHCELRGTSYSGPLLNLYRPAYPGSWDNDGKGGFIIKQDDVQTVATVYSGARTLKKDEALTFDFALIITPVKKIDYKSQFTNRYYHNGGKPTPSVEDVEAGVKVINVHHANSLNPFINYPFFTPDSLQSFVSDWHQKDCKVKIYYTVRELSNVTTEIWALRSLGDEILRGGDGGGFPWCREHYVTDYTPQWYQHFEKDIMGVTADASVLTATGDSRWYNYYIEGLAWLVKNVDIDGIYLDDVAFDRGILKRMRRAMDGVKPGCFIDLHSNTGFSKGPAIQYTEFFPYVDKLWLGESFIYDKMSPANWLVEVSGIPFGLMGDMLHGGGNRWLGMQYGMTVRHPWVTEGVTCDPRVIWKVWDDFDISSSQLSGFWDESPDVTSSDPDVKVTSYIKDGKTLLSIGNYAEGTKSVTLKFNWDKLGLDPAKAVLSAPEMKDFQPAKTFSYLDRIPVEPKKGWLIIITEK